MKKSISKKLFSLFLAVMMLATSLPFTALTASASSVAASGLNKRYVFAYFTGTNNGGQKVNIAASDDGLNYSKVSELNQTKGSGATRDPYLFDGEDGYYYIIGTDADCSTGWWGNSKTMILWRSADLVNWDSETIINMEEIIEKYTSADETVNRCWAPQVYVCDADEQALNGGYKYMVYFALAASNTTGDRTIMYRCFTNNLLDQNAWQMPVLMHDQSYAQSENRGAIDGDILKISNNEYIMYVKDENIAGKGASSTATSRSYWVTASTPWGPYENQGYSTERSVGPSSGQFEGVNNFYIGSDLYLIGDSNASADASTDNMKVYKATDSTGKHFTDVTSTTNIPSLTPKHGSIINLTEYDIQDVRDAMTAFENLVKTGKKYNNIADAYAKYVRCQQLVDAYDYGLRTDLDYNTAVNGLNFAMAHMTEWSAYHGTAVPSFADTSNDNASNYTLNGHTYFNNLLYSPQQAATGNSTGDSDYKKNAAGSAGSSGSVYIAFYNVPTTLLYTGIAGDEPEFPVMFRVERETSKKRYVWIANPSVSASNGENSTDFRCYGYWNGSETSWGANSARSANWVWTMQNGKNHPQYSMPVQNDSNYRMTATGNGSTGMRIISAAANSVIYQGGSELGNQYSKEYTLYWHTYLGGDYTTDETFVTSNNKINVINVAPLLSKINSEYSKINNAANYKEGGMLKFAVALDNALAFNPNDYFINGQNNISGCSNKISELLNGFNNTALVDDSSAYADLREYLDKKAVKGTCTQENLWTAYQEAVANARAAMVNVYTAEKYADTYSGTSIQDIAKTLKDAYEAVTTQLKHEQIKYVSEEGNTATFNCVKDSAHEAVQTADITVYNLLKLVYGTIDPDKYSDGGDAVKAAKAEFDKLPQLTVTTAEKTAQRAVDDLITALLNAANSNAKHFNVKFYVNTDGTSVLTKDEDYSYDSVVPLIAGTDAQCTGWTVETADSTKAIAYYGSTYDVRIQEDCTVTAYFTSKETNNLVTVCNQYGNVLWQFAADKIEINGSTITANGKDYKVPDMPYMKVTGFRIGGTQLADGVMDVTQPIKLYPVHTRTGSTSTVKLDDTVIGTPVYDEVVTLDTNVANAYAIAIKLADDNYSIVAYGTHYEYYANLDKNFVTVTKQGDTYATTDGYTFTDKLTIHKLDNKLPFVYSTAANTDPDNNKYTAFNAYSTQNGDVEILEVGTIFSQTAHTNETLVVDGEGVIKSISKNQIDFSNQYSLSLKNAIGKNVSTRAYVKYQYTLYDGNKITVIEYSDICNTDNL